MYQNRYYSYAMSITISLESKTRGRTERETQSSAGRDPSRASAGASVIMTATGVYFATCSGHETRWCIDGGFVRYYGWGWKWSVS